MQDHQEIESFFVSDHLVNAIRPVFYLMLFYVSFVMLQSKYVILFKLYLWEEDVEMKIA